MDEFKTCPFCGQQIITDRDPQDVCKCEGAQKYREREENAQRLRSAVFQLFGEDCDKVNESYSPVTTDQLECLLFAARAVATSPIDRISMTLENGDGVKITARGVERNKKINSKINS